MYLWRIHPGNTTGTKAAPCGIPWLAIFISLDFWILHTVNEDLSTILQILFNNVYGTTENIFLFSVDCLNYRLQEPTFNAGVLLRQQVVLLPSLLLDGAASLCTDSNEVDGDGISSTMEVGGQWNH